MNRSLLGPSLTLLILLGAIGTTMEVPAQGVRQQGIQSTFLLLRGADTVAVERVTRTAGTLEAELTGSNQSRISYTAELTPDATVRRLEVRAFPPGTPAGSPPAQRAVGTFQGDSVIGEVTQGGTTRTERAATTAGAIPYVNPSPSLMEQIIRRARRLGGDSVQVPVFMVGGGQTMPASVRLIAPDSALLSVAGVEVRMRIDSAGSIPGGQVPAQNLVIERR